MKKLLYVLSLLIIASMVLAACDHAFTPSSQPVGDNVTFLEPKGDYIVTVPEEYPTNLLPAGMTDVELEDNFSKENGEYKTEVNYKSHHSGGSDYDGMVFTLTQNGTVLTNFEVDSLHCTVVNGSRTRFLYWDLSDRVSMKFVPCSK